MSVRAKISVSGRVQDVSFREEVDEAAIHLGLTGLVQNLEDGTVEIICEGEKEKIEELIRIIHLLKYPIMVKNAAAEYSEATAEFKDFTIIKDKKDEDIIANIKTGFRHIKDMHRDLAEKQEATINAIKTMDSHIGTMDSHIGTMDSHIGTMDSHVQGLDKGQSETTIAIKAMALDMKDMKGSMSGISSDIHDIKLAAFPPKRKIKKQVLKQARSRS